MGLTDIKGIGPELAEVLAGDGWTAMRIAAARPAQLEKYQGIGPTSAWNIIDAARAMVRSDPMPTRRIQRVGNTLRCIWMTRLVVGAEQTPSGTRYDLMPQGVQTVEPQDAKYLLSLEREQKACCSGTPYQILKMFEEV